MLPPLFFWAEGWLIASEKLTVIPEHWVLGTGAPEDKEIEPVRGQKVL